MAAITFLMSSLARLRVSARTDRPDMAAAGAAGAGTLLPRHGESRASRAAARPPQQQQRHRGRRPLRARVREEARAPARLLGLEASARLRAPPRAALPGRPGSPLGPQAGRGTRRAGGTCCGKGEVRGAHSGVPGSQGVWRLAPLSSGHGCCLYLCFRHLTLTGAWFCCLISSALAFQIILLCSNHRISHLSSELCRHLFPSWNSLIALPGELTTYSSNIQIQLRGAFP